MEQNKTIPQDFTEFLYWLKKETEAFWNADIQFEKYLYPSEEWIHGAKWIGLEEFEIDNIEKNYQIKFTPEHRVFLKILHTIDRKKVIIDEDIEEEELSPFFYNWLTDEDDIETRLNWVHDTILFDVLKNTAWLKSWGTKPESESEKKKIFESWYNSAPTLIPITSHRFVVNQQIEGSYPVLSVWGSDTIVYGWNLRSYLLNELGSHLPNLFEKKYDPEDDCLYFERKDYFQDIFDNEDAVMEYNMISHWGELIEYSNPKKMN